MECLPHEMHKACLFIVYMWLVILNVFEILHGQCLKEECGSFWCSLDVSCLEFYCQRDRQSSTVSTCSVVPSWDVDVTIRRDQESPSFVLQCGSSIAVLGCLARCRLSVQFCCCAECDSERKTLYITVVFFLLVTTDFSHPPPSSPLHL